MKSFWLILSSVLLSLVLGFFLFGKPQQETASAAQTETAYQRVMRTKELRCGYIVWPPFFIIDPASKEVSGLGHDVAQAVATVLGLKTKWIEIQCGQQLEALLSKRIDMVCTDGPFDMSLALYTAYTKSFSFQSADFYVRIDDKRFDGNPDLLNEPSTRFVGMDGDFSSEVVRKEYPKATLLTLSQNADPSQMMMDIIAGKADVLFIDRPSIKLFMENNPGKLRRLPLDTPLHAYPATFSVLPEETDFLRLLNMGIDLLTYTGELDRILNRYDPDHTLILRQATPYRN